MSESINGAVKRITNKRKWVPLVKAFLHQPLRAYNSCVLYSKKLSAQKYMPLAQRYYDTDIVVSMNFNYLQKGEVYTVLYRDNVVVKVKKEKKSFYLFLQPRSGPRNPLCSHTVY